MHATTDKGDIGVLKVTIDLISKGFEVCYPISATCPFDLIAYKDTFRRIQVKYRTFHNGLLSVNLKRSIITNSKISHVKNDYIDILAIYSPEIDRCLYIPTEMINKCISIRMEATKNNQRKNIHFVEDFTKI